MGYLKHWAREYGSMYCEIVLRCGSHETKHLVPHSMEDDFFYPEQGNESYYVNEGEWSLFAADIAGWNDHFWEKVEEFHDIGRRYVDHAEHLSVSNFPAFAGTWRDYTVYIWWGLHSIEVYVKRAAETLEKAYGKEALSLLVPSERSGIYRLHEEIEKASSFDDAFVGRIWKEFCWIPCLDLHNPPWTKEQMRRYCLEHRKAEEKDVPRIRLSAEHAEMVRKAQAFLSIKDLRDDYRRQATYHARLFFERLGKEKGLGPEDYSFCLTHEILKPDRKAIAERKKGFALVKKDGRVVFADPAALKARVETHSPGESLRGIGACPGKVSGTCRIVKGVGDLSRVKAGDIMVAITTHPDFVPAMERASAIVTDEGGITSHAAIVARELKKPCVVGTKAATSRFSDGETLEVDADRGTVKRL